MNRLVSNVLLMAALAQPAVGQDAARRPMLDEDGNAITRYGLPLAEDGDYLWAEDAGYMEFRGMVRTESGGWRPPTIDDALREIVRPWEAEMSPPTRLAVTILRQEREARPAAELDAFAERLVDLAIAEGGEVAFYALGVFGDPDVHDGAFDRVLRYHEATAGDLPPHRAVPTFRHLYRLEPETRGRDLLLATIAGTELPERRESHASPWCHYVKYLAEGGAVPEASTWEDMARIRREHLRRELRELPDADRYMELWTDACAEGRAVIYN